MHGARSGNVMVYYNAKVLMVDFLVFGSRTFSFFLDEELYEIKIEQAGRGYHYSVQQNLEANTPSNQAIKKEDSKNKRIAWIFALGLVLAFAAILIWTKNYREKLLVQKGKESYALFRVVEADDTLVVHYGFDVGYEKYISPAKEYQKYALLPNGLPLQDGDRIRVRFYPENPDLHRLDYFTIPDTQIDRYINTVLKVHAGLNAEDSEEKLRCQLQLAYQLKGVEGLALFYHQQTAEEENKRFNNNAFHRFTRELPYQKGLPNCP